MSGKRLIPLTKTHILKTKSKGDDRMSKTPSQIRTDAELPQYRDKTIDAMAEAKRISRDPEVKGYNSIEELKAALDD